MALPELATVEERHPVTASATATASLAEAERRGKGRPTVGRRDALVAFGATSAALITGHVDSSFLPAARRTSMEVTCVIRYEIDPFQRDAFKQYAENWGRIIPRCGGHLVGYFLPHEGTNDVAWGIIAFDSLASYEAYRAKLKADPEGRANFELAQTKRFIRREERNFVEGVDGTLGIAAAKS